MHSTACAMIVLADQQGLYFAQFERAQHAAQSGDAAAVVAGLAEGLAKRFARSGVVAQSAKIRSACVRISSRLT